MDCIRYRSEDIECQTCNWVGAEESLVMPRSDVSPSCPSCGGDNFLEITEPRPRG